MKYPKVSTFQAQSVGPVSSAPHFPELEQAVLQYWEDNQMFSKSVEQNKSGEGGSNEFVFYDGPPFANGLPHYGHLLTGYVKDVVPRFWTMMGKRVDRRFGWDTHGLPAELEAQRELGIKDVTEIRQMGIGKFNDACRKSVLKYVDEWEEYVNRQARWVDFANDYKTLDTSYMESVIWAFKQLYDKNLAYKGYKVLPYCWQDQTPLSNHELRMDDDVYQERQDNTVTVGMRVEKESYQALLHKLKVPTDEILNQWEQLPLLAVWTTTPWTLPTNFAVAVNPDLNYVLATAVEKDLPLYGEVVLMGATAINNYKKELGEAPQILATFKGKELKGLRYHPIFDYFSQNYEAPDVNLSDAYQVALADYVGESEGTGLVHLAPYGEDDMVVLGELGVVPPVPMDDGAVLTSEIKDYSGLHVFDANRPIVADLRDGTGSQSRIDPEFRAQLIRTQSVAHSYPHCWRCRQPLIYRPISSWFVSVTQIKQRMLELNDNIKWIPDNVKHGQFGKWLEGARDWSISRNRFWGAPIPVWVSDNPDYPRTEVYGSVAELQTAFADCLATDSQALKAYPNGQIDDLHRPKIDTLWRTNPDDPSGKSKMVRITDVFDCWFESGAMPFASVHYPFENKQWFEEHYPSDFIVEYIGQTRGWFYTLHIMATALFDCNAFKNVMCHGIVLGDDGQKMSKSLRNYPDVCKVFDLYGSDAMRWFLMSSNILRGGNLSVTETAIKDTVRNTLLPLWNSYYFFTMYANSSANGAGIEARRLEPRDYPRLQIQDRYILSKLRPLLENVTANLKQFEVAAATENFRDFLDVLTNWYIRTQRERFWKEDQLAFDTLWTVLEFLTRALSPLLPLTTEEIWRGLTGGESVHLMNYPALELDRNADETLIYDAKLTDAVDLVRDIVSTTLSLRKNSNIRVRQPLQLLQVAVSNPRQVQEFVEILTNELNLKDIELLDADQVQMEDYGLSNQLIPNARVLGPRLGKRVQDIIRSAKSGQWRLAEGVPIVQLDDGNVALKEGEYALNVVVGNQDDSENVDQTATTLKSGGFVKLDLKLTEQLLLEGMARDLIRQIQEQRKLSRFDISDRIHLQLTLPEQQAQAAQEFKDLIASEVLAVKFDVSVGEEVIGMQVV